MRLPSILFSLLGISKNVLAEPVILHNSNKPITYEDWEVPFEVASKDHLWHLDGIDGKLDDVMNRPDVPANSPDVNVYVIDKGFVDSHEAFNGTHVYSTVKHSPVFNKYKIKTIEYDNECITGLYHNYGFYGVVCNEEGNYVDLLPYFKDPRYIPIPENAVNNYEICAAEEEFHGASVASVIAGNIKGTPIGIAANLPGVNLILVKIEGMHDIVDGIDWSIADCETAQQDNPRTKCIFNISVADQYPDTLLPKDADALRKIIALDIPQAIKKILFPEAKSLDEINDKLINASKKGIGITIAAGNEAQNACNLYPSNILQKFTPSHNDGPIMVVGAMNRKGQVTEFSNYGPCINVYAAGSGILTAHVGNGREFILADGTSFGAPLVAGAMTVLYKRHENLPDIHAELQELLHTKTMAIEKTHEIIDFVPAWASSLIQDSIPATEGDGLRPKVITNKVLIFSKLTASTQDRSCADSVKLTTRTCKAFPK